MFSYSKLSEIPCRLFLKLKERGKEGISPLMKSLRCFFTFFSPNANCFLQNFQVVLVSAFGMFKEIWLSYNEVVHEMCISHMKIYFYSFKGACMEITHGEL